jgi:hypothetical protein
MAAELLGGQEGVGFRNSVIARSSSWFVESRFDSPANREIGHPEIASANKRRRDV